MIKTHIIVDFYKADRAVLAKCEALKTAINGALGGLNLVAQQDSYIQFEPEGVTATIVGEGFHFSIHTWPEFHSCAIDLYSAQDQSFARQIAEALKKEFQAQEYDFKSLDRSIN